ncbi:MAG: LAGLIDADG family homing endonuclease [Candidatus Paceibacterota bacterium]
MGRTKPIVSKDYIVGLTEEKGVFMLQCGNPPPIKWVMVLECIFILKCRKKDKPLLEKIKNTLGCGNVYFQKESIAKCF